MMLETSIVIQAEIEGFTGLTQVRTVNRLRYLGIDPKLIDAAMVAVADSPAYRQAEADIILFAMELWSVEDDIALEILNGQRPCPVSNHH